MERFDLNSLCVCGHTLNYNCDHMDIGIGKYCVGKLSPDCRYITFKLDNLKYLEVLSKEKEVADLK